MSPRNASHPSETRSPVSPTARAYVFKPNESELRWMGDTSAFFLATGELTGGAFGLVDERAKRGVGAPLHRHDEDVESFYVLEGEVTFFLGDAPGQQVSAGGFAHIPKGTVHGFRIDSETARYLILTTPRHAEFYRAITGTEVRAAIGKATIDQACRDYGITFVGPLPEQA